VNEVKTQEAPAALVTGAGRRIGAAIAEHLHQAGFQVVVHYHHSREAAEKLIEKLNEKRPASAYCIQADLAVRAQAQRLITDTVDYCGRLDLLVNNASLFLKTAPDFVADDVLQQLFVTNVQAPLWLSQAAYTHLDKQQGAIINITDTHAERPLRGYSVYCQTKAALAMQTQSLALEFAPRVRVNAVAPGAIIWPENENTLNDTKKKQIIEKTLLKCHGNPLYVAQAVLALAQNPFITGQTLRVDGGRGL